MEKFQRCRGIIVLNLLFVGAVAVLTIFVSLKFLPSAGAQTAQNYLPTPQNPIIAKVLNPENRETNIQPLIVVSNNQLHVSVPEPASNFRPGKYKLELWIWQNGIIYYTENDFTWGVLAVNFNKSIYNFGDQAKIGFAVLNDLGQTRCNAEINMSIAAPSGKVFYFTTRDKTVSVSQTCGPQTVTNEPDYSATIMAQEAGTYAVYVSATNENGTRQISDKFEVQNQPLFDIERISPTRIYPPANYKVSIIIRANQDFSGNITETAPASFDIVTEKFAQKTFTGSAGSSQARDTQTITWPVIIKKGDSITLNYYFKAPDISPELYKLGPLQIGNWAEARQWQIAADAAGDVILMWEGTSANVPAGWTCLNCATTDPLYGVFPRASSTYASASSSADTVTHTLTFSTSTLGAGTSGAGAGTAFPNVNHTHTWGNPALSTQDIKPPFKNLLFIKANAPTSLPAGIIGMFDIAATSSLPSGWTSYDLLNSSGTTLVYLRGGENTTSTGGSATHVHTTTATLTSGTSNNANVDPGNGLTIARASHTHTIASGSALPSNNNNPSFATIVFGKLSSASSIPTGLVAFFDNTALPANWSMITTSTVSGSSFLGNLLVGSSTAGTTGGVASHSHSDSVVFTSSGPSGTANSAASTGTGQATSNHTHNVTYTISSASSLPVYRDVILGKFTAPANSPPSVSGVTLNGGTNLTLTPNATTSFNISYSITDTNGCSNINTNTATSTAFRKGIQATCAVPNPTTNNLNCYLNLTRATSSCIGGTQINVTDTVAIYYFAQSTGNASSSFPSDNWAAFAMANDTAGATGSATSSAVNVNILTSISVTTSSINYGNIVASSTSGPINQVATTTNVGNSSTTLKVRATATLTNGLLSIPTSSQRFATSTFTFPGGATQLSDIDKAITGFLLTSPTSTASVQLPTFWGLEVPAGMATGTYSGTNVFTSVFSP